MSFDERVVQGLGAVRSARTREAVHRLIEMADAAPQHSDCVTQLLTRLSARTGPEAEAELVNLLKRSDPKSDWIYRILTTVDGRKLGKATPHLHQLHEHGSLEWHITFAFSDLYMRLGIWLLTQLWRSAELATSANQAIEQWQAISAAACARSLLEGAAYLAVEGPQLAVMWDEFKRRGEPTQESLDGFARDLNNQITGLYYGSRVGQGQGRKPPISSTNVMTYLNKLAKETTDLNVIDPYEWLCDAVHPSFGSWTTYNIDCLRDAADSHLFERYARHPLQGIIDSPETAEPAVIRKAADALILAGQVLSDNLTRVRWVLDDVGLTTGVAGALRVDFPLAVYRAERNSPCPCGSGRKFKRCVHRWGDPSDPVGRAGLEPATYGL